MQESIVGCLPSVVIPNESTETDDQNRRAFGAADKGYCLAATELNDIRSQINQIADVGIQDRLRRNMLTAPSADGAQEAARIIMDFLCKSGISHRGVCEDVR